MNPAPFGEGETLMAAAPVVHIVDDDGDLRLALDGLFRSVGLTTRLYASAAEFMAAKRADAPGCMILDVRMPGLSGLEFQAQLVAAGVRLPIIMMTGFGDIPMTVQAMKAGAINFLTKPFRDQELLDTVGAAIEKDVAQRAERAGVADVHRLFSGLTPREKEVMCLVTAGRMNKQIANDLSISEVTVKIHRGAVMRKMEVRSLADLVRAGETLELSGERR